MAAALPIVAPHGPAAVISHGPHSAAVNTTLSLPGMDVDNTFSSQIHEIRGGGGGGQAPGVRQADYVLNRDKQLHRIVNDTKLPDFDIEVKDSGKSVNINCNSGAFKEVVKPFFSCNASFSDTKYNVTCDSHKNLSDQQGNEVTTKIRFTVSPRDKPPDNVVAKITVHPYNSARRVQIQEGKMSDTDLHGPVWFSHFLKAHFEETAKKRRFDISQFNSALEKLGPFLAQSSHSSSNCSLCDRSMNGQSRPVQCSTCDKSFHKTCFMKLENSSKVPNPGWVCHDADGSVRLKLLPPSPTPPPRQSLRNTKRPRLDYGDVGDDSEPDQSSIPIGSHPAITSEDLRLPTPSPVSTSTPPALSATVPVTSVSAVTAVTAVTNSTSVISNLNPAAANFTPVPSPPVSAPPPDRKFYFLI